MDLDYRSMSSEELERWAGSLGLPAYRGRQIFQWLWRPGLRDFSCMTDLPKDLRKRFSELGRLYSLRLVVRQRSKDGTEKFGFQLHDGLVIESVLIPERRHYTICISSQVGCKMGCRFCHTAKMGFHRDLLPSEIAGQVLSVLELAIERDKLRNIVFMGMGEPLANYSNVLKALAILTDPKGLNFSLRRITLSTCGLVPEILRLGQDTDVGLAISLHAADDGTRSAIMPINRKYGMDKLLDACRNYPLSPRRRITFEYLLLKDINDSLEQAARLAKILRGIPAKINLIPFNQSSALKFRRPSEARILAFQKVLTDANYTAIIRKSKGEDISAACGQLYADFLSTPSQRNVIAGGQNSCPSEDVAPM